jgi:hypothetical protein
MHLERYAEIAWRDLPKLRESDWCAVFEALGSVPVHYAPGTVDQAKCADSHNRSVVERIARRLNGPALPVQRGRESPLLIDAEPRQEG